MGSPDLYYKKVLQALSHNLLFMEDEVKAHDMYKEESVEKLEDFVLGQKQNMDEKHFYYEAGKSCQYVLNMAEKVGTDAFNACFGGLFEFEDLIGLIEDEE